jgi:hypothetical protein
MSVYLTVAAAAAAVGADVFVYWHDNPNDPAQPMHARMAYEAVRRSLRWPPNMHVLSESQFQRQTRHMPAIEYNAPGLLVSYHAFDGVYTTAWKTFRLPDTLPPLSRDIFERAYRSVARDTSVTCPAQSCEPASATKFLVLHFRGSDKNAPPAEFNTAEVLRRLPAHVPVVVVTDDHTQLHELLSAAAPYVANVTMFCPIHDEAVKRLCDFALLLNASGIIQHSTNAWSSYSSVPAMMRGIPLLNTWIGRAELRPHNTSSVGLLHSFAENGGCPIELTSSKWDAQISAFMDMVQQS